MTIPTLSIPKGYELDLENSSASHILLKQITKPSLYFQDWDDVPEGALIKVTLPEQGEIVKRYMCYADQHNVYFYPMGADKETHDAGDVLCHASKKDVMLIRPYKEGEAHIDYPQFLEAVATIQDTEVPEISDGAGVDRIKNRLLASYAVDFDDAFQLVLELSNNTDLFKPKGTNQ